MKNQFNKLGRPVGLSITKSTKSTASEAERVLTDASKRSSLLSIERSEINQQTPEGPHRVQRTHPITKLGKVSMKQLNYLFSVLLLILFNAPSYAQVNIEEYRQEEGDTGFSGSFAAGVEAQSWFGTGIQSSPSRTNMVRIGHHSSMRLSTTIGAQKVLSGHVGNPKSEFIVIRRRRI